MPRVIGALRLTGCVTLLSGCLSPNGYSTPRTVSPGQVSHSLAAEGAEWFSNPSSPVAKSKGLSSDGAVPMVAYTARVGAADRIDLGIRVAAPVVGLDAKWNFVRTEYFDLSVDPRAQAGIGHSSDPGYVALYIPLLAGFNLSRSFSIVAAAGYSRVIGECAMTSILAGDLPVSGPMLLATFGLDIRVARTFAVHPELTWMPGLRGEHDALDKIWIFGVGFNWGALPRFD